jgi:hypothetical protein
MAMSSEEMAEKRAGYRLTVSKNGRYYASRLQMFLRGKHKDRP